MPGRRDELLCRLEHLLDRAAVPQRAGDGADELGHREGRLLLGKPIQREQAVVICPRST